MNHSSTDTEKPEAGSRSALASGDDPKPTGMEINLGDFTRTQGLMKSLRLTLDNQIVIPVEEIASGLNEAGRKFKVGDLEQANQDVTRLYASFGQKTSQWDARARSLEQQMRLQASKNPKSISIDTMTRMKSEQIAVRSRIATAEVHFRRLHQGLDQAWSNFQSRPIAGIPSGFLARFKAAALDNRPALVKEHFESTAAIVVTIQRATSGGYAVQFTPRPTPGSLLFVTTTGQLHRLHELGAIVVTEDMESGGKSEMKVGQFVKLVEAGVWLLPNA